MYEAKNYDHLIGMKGFSETLLRNHFALYQGYVANTNKLAETLSTMAKEGKFGVEFAELKRRFGWEWNGMRLHELYFNNLGGKSGPPTSGKLFDAIVKTWGSFDAWQKEFIEMGKMRGIGWVILYWDRCEDRLFNQWIGEHDQGHLASGKPLLVMDVFEHAFITDYGLKRADYIDAFFNNINWDKVSERFEKG